MGRRGQRIGPRILTSTLRASKARTLGVASGAPDVFDQPHVDLIDRVTEPVDRRHHRVVLASYLDAVVLYPDQPSLLRSTQPELDLRYHLRRAASHLLEPLDLAG